MTNERPDFLIAWPIARPAWPPPMMIVSKNSVSVLMTSTIRNVSGPASGETTIFWWRRAWAFCVDGDYVRPCWYA